MWPRLRASIESAMGGEGSVVQEFRTRSGEDGARTSGVYQLCFSPVLDECQDIAGVLIDIFDVTARTAEEETLRGEVDLLNTLFSRTPVLIAYGTAPDLELQYVNAAFARLFEGRSLLGHPVAEAIPEAAEQGFMEILRGVLATGESWEGHDIPFSIRTPDRAGDTLHYVDFVYQPLPAADGSIAGILFSGYEVTDRRRAMEESERLRHELLHSSRMSAMGTMAVTIAHELNQPLTAAANYLSMAEFGLGGDPSHAREMKDLDAARDQILRAGTIVRRMRSLVACGEARTEAFDLEKGVMRAIELVRASGNLDGLTVEIEIAEDARRVLGDDVQVEQVLVNLLRNAAQASLRAGGRHSARLAAARAGTMIEVSLRDWGPGLPPERLEDLFATPPEPRGGDGLGVGLLLCRTIVEAHGGQINGRNCDDGGALFTFTLPAAPDQAR